MTTVYVVAWQYNTGSGFDWYWKESDADEGYQKELQNVEELADEGWSAYRFDVELPQVEDKDSEARQQRITDYIDADLDGYCARATRKQENILDEYGKTLTELNEETF